MMDIPIRIPMQVESFMDGAGGYALHKFHNIVLGIHLSRERSSRNAEWKETWTIDSLPGRFFNSGKEMREAAAEVNKL